jgi:hypothetical protein
MPRTFQWVDLLIAGGALVATTVSLLSWTTRVDVRATGEEARLAELDARKINAAAMLAELERRANEDAALRQTVARRVEDLQARFPARFSTALAEASRARPQGVWLTRFCWAGAEVKAEGHAWGAAPTAEFAGRLARNPHFAQVFTAPARSDLGGPDRFLLFARAVAR